jgi:hypothetical protein
MLCLYIKSMHIYLHKHRIALHGTINSGCLCKREWKTKKITVEGEHFSSLSFLYGCTYTQIYTLHNVYMLYTYFIHT